MKPEQNNHLEDIKEFVEDCTYEDAAGSNKMTKSEAKP